MESHPGLSHHPWVKMDLKLNCSAQHVFQESRVGVLVSLACCNRLFNSSVLEARSWDHFKGAAWPGPGESCLSRVGTTAFLLCPYEKKGEFTVYS